MGRFVEGEDRRQGVLLPEHLDEFVAEENPVRIIEAFVEEGPRGSRSDDKTKAGRRGRNTIKSALLKIYVHGYINQIASIRRFEREGCSGFDFVKNRRLGVPASICARLLGWHYHQPNAIERFINKLKHFRAAASQMTNATIISSQLSNWRQHEFGSELISP